MARRGPIPGTTGRNPAEVAAVALAAQACGAPVAASVAERYGCTLAAAKALVSRARLAGHEIPYDYFAGTKVSPERYAAWRAAVTRGNAARTRKALERRAVVAATVAAAKGAGLPIRAAVAEVLGVNENAASAAIHQARKHGTPDMPPARRYERDAPFADFGPLPSFAPLGLACDCGQPADTIDALTRHTLAAHHRAPTRTERTPRRNKVAA